jgi:hypothetical protein
VSNPSTEVLTVELLTNETVHTPEIESQLLDRVSVQSSIRQQMILDPNAPDAPPAEQGIAELLVALHRWHAEPLDYNRRPIVHEVVRPNVVFVVRPEPQLRAIVEQQTTMFPPTASGLSGPAVSSSPRHASGSRASSPCSAAS